LNMAHQGGWGNPQNQPNQQQYGSQYGASQANLNQGGSPQPQQQQYGNQQPPNQQYGQQPQYGNPPQQQYNQQQQQYANSQYGGSQMNFNQNQPPQQAQGQYGGYQMNQQQQAQQAQQPYGGSQYAPSQYGGGSQYGQSQQNLNQHGGNKYGAYGSQLNFQNSAVKDSSMNLNAQNQWQQHQNNNQSMTESQMSLQDPNRKVKLKPLKWEKPLKKGKQKTQIFVWGKARPPNMFPASSDQLTPYHVDNLSKKKIWDVCAAREGHHCFGIGQNDWCFVWGETKQKGALGLGRGVHSTTPFLVRSLRKEKVKQACCSAIHSLCITEQMVIYG